MRLIPLLGLLLGGSPVPAEQDFPRLRTTLPSGSVIFVENMPKASRFSVHLIASAYGVREARENHGWRHLLEHLIVKGPDKSLQSRLEAQGVVLHADTYRDGMVFSLFGTADRLDLALNALPELMKPLAATQEEIDKEVKIIGEELAILSPSKKLSRELWNRVFGDSGLDPLGSPEAMAKANPQSLEHLRRRHFAAQNLVISIAAPCDIEATITRCRAILPRDKDPFEPDVSKRQSAAMHAAARVDDAEGKAAVAPGWAEPETAALVAAALGLASEKGRCSMIYTPSLQPGLVILASEEPDLGAWLANLKTYQIDGFFARGRSLAEQWVTSQLGSTQGNAFLRGFLFAQSNQLMAEPFLENVRRLTPEQFRAAAENLMKEPGS